MFVGFGASGDLTRRKLVPALVNLRRSGALPAAFAFIAVIRQADVGKSLADDVLKAADEHLDSPLTQEERDWFLGRIGVVVGDVEQPSLYADIATRLTEMQAAHGIGTNALFYLATPPQLFAPIAAGLGKAGLLDEAAAGGWRRVVVEKPFGHDLESAIALNRALSEVMSERQIYRIDHYLGKETVQNLMIFRFANSIFEPIWNRRYVDHVQITVAESDGIGSRGGYYDQAGALRDMVQNHLFMLLALTAMEPPISFDADAVRDERLKVLQAITPFTRAMVERDVVRAQYAAGRIKDADGAAATWRKTRSRPHRRPRPSSRCACRWRTGAGRACRSTCAPASDSPGASPRSPSHFRQPPFMMFRDTAVRSLNCNVLVIRVQPEEGITLEVDAKVPGQALDLKTVAMDFKYDEVFAQTPSTGYETLLYDALTGDQTLFHRADSTEVSWRAVMPILEAWPSQSRTGLLRSRLVGSRRGSRTARTRRARVATSVTEPRMARGAVIRLGATPRGGRGSRSQRSPGRARERPWRGAAKLISHWRAGERPAALYRVLASLPFDGLVACPRVVRRRTHGPAGACRQQLPHGARDAALRGARSRSAHVHRWETELAPADAASRYDAALARPGCAAGAAGADLRPAAARDGCRRAHRVAVPGQSAARWSRPPRDAMRAADVRDGCGSAEVARVAAHRSRRRRSARHAPCSCWSSAPTSTRPCAASSASRPDPVDAPATLLHDVPGDLAWYVDRAALFGGAVEGYGLQAYRLQPAAASTALRSYGCAREVSW